MGRYFKAIESYEIALSLNSKFSAAWYNKGNAYASLGNIIRAIECYKLAIQYNRKDLYALYNLANSFEQIGKCTEAIDAYTRVITLDPKHYESFFGRGNSNYQLENYDLALKDFNSAISLYNENPDIWYAKADTEYNLGKLAESVESYWKVIKYDPHNYNALLDLSNTLIECEDYDRAENTLKHLINYKPGWCEPYYSKAKLCFLIGEIEDGLKMLETGFAINPEDRFDYDFEKDWEKILHFLISK
jgi:tetratricopeptide (TPR) repeat protein